jgi:hypothetical protein
MPLLGDKTTKNASPPATAAHGIGPLVIAVVTHSVVSSGVQPSVLVCRLLSSLRTKSLLDTPGGKRPSANACRQHHTGHK